MLFQWGGSQKKLGGSTSETGDPNCPKGCCTTLPWNVMPSIWTGGTYLVEKLIWVRERALSVISQQEVSNSIVHHLFLTLLLFHYYFYHHHHHHLTLLLYFNLFSIIKLFLSQCPSLTFIILPIPLGWWGGERVKWVTAWCFITAGIKPDTRTWRPADNSNWYISSQVIQIS